ncbi:MAG TPA: hypothetical protein VIU29_08600 [Candidatus Deferrimicrobiaceae bacterium]
MKTARCCPLLLAAMLTFSIHPAGAAGLAVDLKNDESRSISVTVGSDNGVTRESDFEVILGKDQTVPVFPAEIFKDRFWSAPLSPEDFDSIRIGAPVQPLAAGKTAHGLMRKLAAEQQKTLRREQAETKQAETGKKLAELRDRRSRLQAEKEKLDGWIASADSDIAEEKGRVQWRDDSAEQDIARSQQRIGDLTDQRNELQSQRDALPRKDKAGRDRLTAQIASINSSIASERNTLRYAQDRKREARTFLRRNVVDKGRMIADRDALAVEIRALDREIADVQGR